jgi:hypothetical protein
MAVSIKVLGSKNSHFEFSFYFVSAAKNSHFEFSFYFVSAVCFDVSEERTAHILQPSEKKIFYRPKRMEKSDVNHGVQAENRPRFEQQLQRKP